MARIPDVFERPYAYVTGYETPAEREAAAQRAEEARMEVAPRNAAKAREREAECLARGATEAAAWWRGWAEHFDGQDSRRRAA